MNKKDHSELFPIERLEVNGFAVLEVLGNEAVEALSKRCDDYFQNNQPGDFLSTSHFLDPGESKSLNTLLHKYLQPAVERQLPQLELLGGTLATKKPNRSNLVAHQDWSIVDESKYHSYNLWIALVDTNKENGTLALLPGSHKWASGLRGQDIENPYAKYTAKLTGLGVEPALKAGQAILYNHRLLHYSRPNRSNALRHVAIVGMKDQEATLSVSFQKDGKLLTYKASEEDFYAIDLAAIQKNNTCVGEKEYHPESRSWREIQATYRQHLTEDLAHLVPERRSVLAKLMDKFTS